MKRFVPLVLLAALALPATATAQGLTARRMGMGGVMLGGRGGSESDNVAYRALPRSGHASSGFSLPIGLIPLLGDLPSFDPNHPDFNVFELANLVENPPWNLALTRPHTPASDVSLDIAQNSLQVDLGDIASAFPRGDARAYGDLNGPAASSGFRRMFVALAPLAEFENELRLNAALSGVLHDGDSIRTNERYEARDVGLAQAATALHLGVAFPLFECRGSETCASGLYAGARAKVLRGLAYGEAHNVAAYATGDTLFGSQALDLEYDGRYFDAGPQDGGWGYGLDAGTVWTLGGFELGLAVNDVGTRIDWRVRETLAHRDSASGELNAVTVATGQALTSRVPSTVVANAALHAQRWTLAADVRQNVFATTAHAGLERWLGPVALRAGGGVDSNRRTQVSGGLGLRLGAIGFDVAVATHNRNLENERMVELGAGFELYH